MSSLRIIPLWLLAALFLPAGVVFGQGVDSICFNTAPAPFVSQAPASGGDSTYLYLWQDSTVGGAWAPAPGVNDGLTYQATALTTTTHYRRQVTSAACGVAFSNVLTVEVFPELTAQTNGLDVSCEGGSDGSIDLTVNGGLPPYDYDWDDGADTEDRANLSAGSYAVT